MKKLIFIPVFIASLCAETFAATRPAARGTRSGTGTETSATAAPSVTAARAATNSRTAPRATTAPATTQTTVNRGRAATPTTTKAPTVAARAGVTQKVISTGTKVAAAAKNIVVDEECQQKFDGCMDSFCMIDNASGGRCMCSNKNAEYDAILAEIEKLDQQSYQMATFGVERIEMGANADAAIAAANAAADSVTREKQTVAETGKKTSRRTLDLSLWDDNSYDFEEEDDVFGDANTSMIDDKQGDELFRASFDLCKSQIPECASEMNMLQLMYSQRIKSDCAAYENTLKQQKKSSQQKLQTAERALREAALEQLQIANKYDLGQCTIEFKKCMQTTAGCGNDFAGCAVAAAMDATNVVKSTSRNTKKQNTYQIKGTITNIEISASTYDNLMAKKPLCESVTKQCVAVADQVWDTFLREVAPQMKNAELIAEDNARQNCIGNISSCFQKACKDNIDPNDPDGSYDMCLTRPATMLNVCKVPLNACGIDASNEAAAEQSDIWDYVLAALAAMRVDSCTNAVKDCLTSEDRCGPDYTQCIGLDTDAIMRMCPFDKLTACQQKYADKSIDDDGVYDELANIVQGIMLNIDNSFLVACQNALNESMIKVCGDTETCNSLIIDENIGARSLEYQICQSQNDEEFSKNGLFSSIQEFLTRIYNNENTDDSTSTNESISDLYNKNCRTSQSQIPDADLKNGDFAGVIKGTIDWSKISPSNTVQETTENGTETTRVVATYFNIDEDAANQMTQQALEDLNVLKNNIDSAFRTIEADPTIQYCMTGRTVQGMKVNDQFKDIKGDRARFPNLTDQIRGIIINAALKSARDNYEEKFTELNEKRAQEDVEIQNRIAKINQEESLAARRENARISCLNMAKNSVLPLTVRLGFFGKEKSEGFESADYKPEEADLTASKSSSDISKKETVTATFEWETLKCNVCTRKQFCENQKRKRCKKWGAETESCKTIPF